MINILYSIWESLWRRMFGSNGWYVPIIKYRAIQHVLNVIITVFVLNALGYSLLQNLLCTAIFEGLFWSRSHGDYFFVTYEGEDEARIKWIDYILKKIYGVAGYYNFKGNVTGLFLRYETPSILVSLITFNWWFLLAGVLVTLSYAICGLLFPNKPYTEYAEYLSGFFAGLLLTL